MRGVASVWHVCREYASVAEAGGIKDVVRGLAEAQARAGMIATVVLPLYGKWRRELLAESRAVAAFGVPVPDLESWSTVREEPVEARSMMRGGVRLLLLDSARYADKRDVYTWTGEDEREDRRRKQGGGHWDAHQMNLLLVRGALEAAVRLRERPDLFHCHDGHAAFLPAILREDPRYAAALAGSAALLTIHNAGEGYHQEVWDRGVAATLTGLAPEVIDKGVLGGKADPLLLAASYATLATVSEHYAEELLAERGPGMSGGLGAALRERRVPLAGITNGVDTETWDPRRPQKTGLPCAFDPGAGELAGKSVCRQQLADRLGWPAARPPTAQPLFAFIGRLAEQKGVGVLQAAARLLHQQGRGVLLAVLGSGDAATEGSIRSLERDLGGRVRFVSGYEPQLAMLIYAAADFIVVPSAYEPCGLTDFHGQLMAAVPVVHAVGGLRKVRDGQTGFRYERQAPDALAAVLARCARIAAEEPGLLDAVRRRAFQEIFELHTWDRVLRDGYLPLYRAAVEASETR